MAVKGHTVAALFLEKILPRLTVQAAYAARHIAKNVVAAGVADEILVQLAYAIGVAQPVNIYVNTYGTAKVQLHDGEIANKISALFDLRALCHRGTLKTAQPDL